MSQTLQIKKISDIKGQLKVCNICKIALIEEYFNHIPISWITGKIDPRIEYEWKYQLGATGQCELGCPREAHCTIYHEESKFAH